MCGISGILSFDGKYNKEDILKMNKILSHRGPDDEGTYFDDFIGLGHRRLSIIDLSKAGHQPMPDDSKRYWIVFNGEVYNYLEIREELIKDGFKFHSNTDTEVVLKSYIKWGKDCLKKFNGMWAFAIWDGEKKELFCARDRFGVKPFYYYHKDNYFVFASEIKAILEVEGIPREPNNIRILQYLGNYPLLENKSTFFKDIFQLPPSHYIIMRKDNFEVEQYWDIEKKEFDNERAKDTFLELFEDSIRLRLRSDVPVGTCLSGGLDSSSIVCVLNKLIDSSKQKTFSSCFEDKRFDERDYIQEVINATNVTPHYIFPDIKQLYPKLFSIIWHHDEPFEGTSILAQWCVMKLAKENKVLVVLDGQGSDEILAGYHPYKWYILLDSIKRKNLVEIIKNYKFLLEAVQSYRKTTNKSFFEFIKQISKSKFRSSKGDSSYAKKYLTDEFLNSNLNELTLSLPLKFNNKLENKLYQDTYFSSLQKLLQYEDRNSMAFSIESRVPFLDYRLVEFVFSLPIKFKINKGWTKYILRKSMKGVLPEKIRCRKDKMGFVTPQDLWVKEIENDVRGIVNSFSKREYVKSEEIPKILDEYYNGNNSLGKLVWKMFCLELWFRVFFEDSYTKDL